MSQVEEYKKGIKNYVLNFFQKTLDFTQENYLN